MAAISQCILISVNILVFILGLAITIFGAIAKWGNTFFSDKIVPFIAQAMANGGAGPSATLTFDKIAKISGQYITNLSAAGLVIFLFGLALILISFCGMCGACKKSKCLLVIYIILVGILMIAMIGLTLAVRFLRGDIATQGKKVLTDYINKTFVGLNAGADAESAILSLVQARLGCCGVENGTIFATAPKWNKTAVVGNTTYTLKYPISCCKMKVGSYDPVDMKCFTNPNSTNSNYEIGCFTKIMDMVNGYSWFVIYGLIGLDIFLFLLIVAAILIIRSIPKDD